MGDGERPQAEGPFSEKPVFSVVVDVVVLPLSSDLIVR